MKQKVYVIKTQADQKIPEYEYDLDDAKKWLDDMEIGETLTIKLLEED